MTTQSFSSPWHLLQYPQFGTLHSLFPQPLDLNQKSVPPSCIKSCSVIPRVISLQGQGLVLWDWNAHTFERRLNPVVHTRGRLYCLCARAKGLRADFLFSLSRDPRFYKQGRRNNMAPHFMLPWVRHPPISMANKPFPSNSFCILLRWLRLARERP